MLILQASELLVIAIALQRGPSQNLQSLAVSYEEFHRKYTSQQAQINQLMNESILRNEAEAQMQKKLQRIHKLASR